MSGLGRLDANSVLHHVIIFGIERKNTSRNNKDFNDLLTHLDDLLSVTNTSCYAWALLSNYAYFLFQTSNIPLSTMMGRQQAG